MFLASENAEMWWMSCSASRMRNSALLPSGTDPQSHPPTRDPDPPELLAQAEDDEFDTCRRAEDFLTIAPRHQSGQFRQFCTEHRDDGWERPLLHLQHLDELGIVGAALVVVWISSSILVILGADGLYPLVLEMVIIVKPRPTTRKYE